MDPPAPPPCETLVWGGLSMNYNVAFVFFVVVFVLPMNYLVFGSKTVYFLSNNWFCDAKAYISLVRIGSVMQKLVFP